MNLIHKKQEIHQAALRLLKEYGIPKKELQACGMVHRAEETEVDPDYLTIATPKTSVMHLSVSRRPSWVNYEELALYLMKRVQKK